MTIELDEEDVFTAVKLLMSQRGFTVTGTPEVAWTMRAAGGDEHPALEAIKVQVEHKQTYPSNDKS